MTQELQQKIVAQQEGGQKLGAIRDTLIEMAAVGVSLLDIEKKAQELIAASGGTPSFQTVEGYKWATCLCVNDVVVHGIPTGYTLQDGDILTIDVGLLYKGYHTDTAWTKIIQNSEGRVQKEKREFLETGEKALMEAIEQAKTGNRVGHISQAIQTRLNQGGYGIVKALVGHGVGKTLHEKPQIPCYLRGTIAGTPPLTEGMVIAIEVMYTLGKGDIVYANDDGWTLATKDHSLSAVFEHTLQVTAEGGKVLT